MINYLFRNSCRSRVGYAMVEFPGILFCFFMFVLFPLLNLVMFTGSFATLMMFSNQIASRSACSRNFDEAISVAETEADHLVKSDFAKFASLKPVGGVKGHGVNLFTTVTNFSDKNALTYGPNTPVPPPIDLARNTYEVVAQVCYDVGPVLDLSCVPVIADVPLLGCPARLSFSAHRALEHPDGWTGSAALAGKMLLVPVHSSSGSGVTVLDGRSESEKHSKDHTLVAESDWAIPRVVTHTAWIPDPDVPGAGYLMSLTWNNVSSLTARGEYLTGSSSDSTLLHTIDTFSTGGVEGFKERMHTNPLKNIELNIGTTISDKKVNGAIEVDEALRMSKSDWKSVMFLKPKFETTGPTIESPMPVTEKELVMIEESFFEMQDWMSKHGISRPNDFEDDITVVRDAFGRVEGELDLDEWDDSSIGDSIRRAFEMLFPRSRG